MAVAFISKRGKSLVKIVPTSACSVVSRLKSDQPGLDFDDHRAAFRHKTSWELIRALTVLRACSSNYLVENSLKLMRIGNKILGERLLNLLLFPTVYSQFVAGSDEASLARAVKQLHLQGLRLMVAPSLEEDINESSTSQDKYDKNLCEMLRLVEVTSKHGGTQPCLQCKVTAMLSAQVLRNLSEVFPEPDISVVEELAKAMTKYSSSQEGEYVHIDLPKISNEDNKQISLAISRFAALGEAARCESVKLLVDAEWSYVNPGCSLIALAMMTAFNQSAPHIANTFQCYFTEARENLKREIETCKKVGACFAAKIVRGAYLEKERDVKYASTCMTHALTGENYNRVLDQALQHVAASNIDRCFLIVATHNESAIHYATERLREIGSTPRAGNIAFAQIYGMAEQISMPLARSGYIVYKSVPIGELVQVLPYLSRRVAENRSVLQGARKERQLLEKEIIYRIRGQARE